MSNSAVPSSNDCNIVTICLFRKNQRTGNEPILRGGRKLLTENELQHFFTTSTTYFGIVCRCSSTLRGSGERFWNSVFSLIKMSASTPIQTGPRHKGGHEEQPRSLPLNRLPELANSRASNDSYEVIWGSFRFFRINSWNF